MQWNFSMTEIMTIQRTDLPTIRQSDRIIGKFHFQ